MSDFPRMLYKTPGPHEIHGDRFDTLIVHDAGHLEDALDDGWHITTTEAKEAPEKAKLEAEARARAEAEAAKAARIKAEEEARQAAEAEARAAAEAQEHARREAEEAAQREAAAKGAAAKAEAEAAAKAVTIPPKEPMPARAELEQKATELGIKFDGRIGDKKLADLIAATLKE